MIKHFWVRYKVFREMKKSAKWLERLADEMPTKSIRELFPDLDPIDARNNLLFQSRRLKCLKFVDVI